MGLAPILGLMEIDMMVSGAKTKSKEEALISLQTKILTLEITKKVNLMGKGPMSGTIKALMKGSSKMGSKKAKEFGGRTKIMLQATNSKVFIKMTRKMGLENLLGKAETFIKEIMLMMKETAMEKCTLQTGLFTKGSG